jgi:hypothetical protein
MRLSLGCILSLCLLAACSGKLQSTTSASACGSFTDSSVGAISLTITGSSVDVDWANDLDSVSDSLSVGLTGSGVAPSTSKPSAFTSVPDGTYQAVVTYSKTGCGTVSNSRSVTVNTTVDCTAWNAQSIGTITVTTGVGTASVDWSGTLSGQTSFSVTATGASTPAAINNTKPAVFTGLTQGDYFAHVTYSKTACSDLTLTKAFTVPISLSADIYPVLAGACAGCHGGNGGFSIGANSAALFTALTSNANASCVPAAANPQRVNVLNDPAVAATSFFYRKVATTQCGTKMAVNGGLTAGQVANILTWISQGALNN